MGYGRGYVLRKWSVLHGPRAVRALAQDGVICLGQAAIDHTLTGVRARVRGYPRADGRHPYPSALLSAHSPPGALADMRRRLRRRHWISRRSPKPPRPDPERAEIERELAIPHAAAGRPEAGARGRSSRSLPPTPSGGGGGTALLVGGPSMPPCRRAPSPCSPRAKRRARGSGIVRRSAGTDAWWSLLEIPPRERRGEVDLALAGGGGGDRDTVELGSLEVEAAASAGAVPARSWTGRSRPPGRRAGR